MKRITPSALVFILALLLPVAPLGAQTPQTGKNGQKGSSAAPAKGPTFATRNQSSPDPGRGIGPFVPGRIYVVTSTQKTLNFAGKEIVLPQGVQFQFQDGYLIVSLPQEADRNVAVVRLGKTYLVVTKKEQLVIDPSGAPRNPKRVVPNTIRTIGQQKTINAILDATDASPVGF